MDISIEVLMSCYKNDNPIYLKEAIDSTYTLQTVKPDSFRIVVDGPVSKEIEDVLRIYTNKYPNVFKIQYLEKNGGLGKALQAGFLKSNHSYILRMDSDDISAKDRIKKQKDYIIKHPEIDVLGTYTAEFLDDWNNPFSIRVLKINHEEILKDAKKRSPVSHVSVLLNKDAVLNSGNYQHFPLYEDYYLWIRMLTNGHVFHNIPEVLVYVRTDKNRYARKGSEMYLKSTIRFQDYLLKIGFINWIEYLRNKYGRLLVGKAPICLRKLIYEIVLRKRPKKGD